MSAADLPLYMDRAACRRLLGLSRVDVERLFRRCPEHAVDGSRKVYIRTEDALPHVRRYEKDQIRRNWEVST